MSVREASKSARPHGWWESCSDARSCRSSGGGVSHDLQPEEQLHQRPRQHRLRAVLRPARHRQHHVCSPRHTAMNLSFVAAGVLMIGGIVAAAAVATSPADDERGRRRAGGRRGGQGHRRPGPGEHQHRAASARQFNIPVAGVAILLISLVIIDQHRTIAILGVVLAVVGLVGTVLSTAGQYAGSGLYLGLGVGGTERLAGYPGNLDAAHRDSRAHRWRGDGRLPGLRPARRTCEVEVRRSAPAVLPAAARLSVPPRRPVRAGPQ